MNPERSAALSGNLVTHSEIKSIKEAIKITVIVELNNSDLSIAT